uniref:Uncharacterized protein n=1 Tax=Oryza sativa subsp. japonica TaxID=39947 RepID=Q7XHZ5_ORYSJ|nr:hypothetical protein [Oryza sativa Japonica Group]BAC84407.1 hypothetical protein [Oryza sativa Japonica Group]
MPCEVMVWGIDDLTVALERNQDCKETTLPFYISIERPKRLIFRLEVLRGTCLGEGKEVERKECMGD